MKFKRQPRNGYEVNLTPLIDVVFLLLIFFMVTTTFTPESLLQVQLPEADGQPVDETPEMIEVVVNADGTFGVNGQVLGGTDKQALRAAIVQAAQGSTDMPFVITADALSTHQAVVMVMDVANALKFDKLSITTRQPEQ